MRFFCQTIPSRHKQGFTFVETLVAITILLVAVVAPMSLAQNGIVAARLAQDQIVAFYLAQEALEIVKNLRDNHRVGNEPGGQLDGSALQKCVVSGSNAPEPGCIVDPHKIQEGQISTERCLGSCQAISLTTSPPLRYTYRVGLGVQATKYVRSVKVWYPDSSNPEEAVVEVVVTWPFGRGGLKTYTVRNFLYDW